MFELNNKVRLIDVSSFELTDSDEFIGFIYGIISQDNDLEQMYLDSFLTIAVAEEDKVNDLFTRLAKIGEKYQITFVVSASVPGSAVADEFRDSIIAEL
jgi:hypothetical protein